jgi:hypothetical protein
MRATVCQCLVHTSLARLHEAAVHIASEPAITRHLAGLEPALRSVEQFGQLRVDRLEFG